MSNITAILTILCVYGGAIALDITTRKGNLRWVLIVHGFLCLVVFGGMLLKIFFGTK